MTAADPNQAILDYLNSQPGEMRETILFVLLMLLEPASYGPDDDLMAAATESIRPPARDQYDRFRAQGAAIKWAAALDYYFTRSTPAITSADLHKWSDDFEEEHGRRGSMRHLADTQDERNARYDAAAEAWWQIRRGPLSLETLERNFFKGAPKTI